MAKKKTERSPDVAGTEKRPSAKAAASKKRGTKSEGFKTTREPKPITSKSPRGARLSLPPFIRPGWYISHVAVSLDGSRVALGRGTGDFGVWQIETGKPLLGPTRLPKHAKLAVLALGNDGHYFCTSTTHNETYLYDVDAGTVTRLLKRLSRAFEFLPAGAGLAVVDGRGVSVFQLGSWKELFKLEGHTTAVHELAVSSDGRFLVSVAGKQAKLWDLLSRRLLADLAGHKKIVQMAAFAPDNAFIATCSEDKTVRLWSIAGDFHAELKGHGDIVMEVCVSPDGRTIAAADFSETIHLWDIVDKSIRASVEADSCAHHTMAFNADGSKLTACTFGQPAQLVDVKNGKTLETLPKAQLAVLVPGRDCLALAVGDELLYVSSQ
jgi:WD40 repeat protein